jgi:MFS family permease
MRQVKPARFVSYPPIIGFSLVIFFVTLADGIVSYMVPIVIGENLSDPALVGLVISISSFFGIALDFLVAQRLPHKGYRYFLTRVFIFAALLSIIFLFLPHKIMFFCIAMIVWSVYYEFIGYSKYNFVQKYIALKDHTNAWGTLVTFGSLAYMIGPGIATLLIYKFFGLPFYIALALVVFSTLLYFLFEKLSFRRREERTLVHEQKRNLFEELGVLKTLLSKLWVLVIFSFVITLMDVLMWTVGVLYSAEIRKTSFLGDWLLVIYGLPALFIGIVTEKVRLGMGKKRASFIAAAAAGLSLIFVGIDGSIYSVLIFVFLMSVFFGISIILIDATFQDYVARAKVVGNDVVSLLQFSHNLSYSFGPIILGIAARYLGYIKTFQLVGYSVLLISLTCFFITPRKIKMPQKELIREIYEMGNTEQIIKTSRLSIGKAKH